MKLNACQIGIRRFGQVLGIGMIFFVITCFMAPSYSEQVETGGAWRLPMVTNLYLCEIGAFISGIILLLPFSWMGKYRSSQIFIIAAYSIISVISLFIWPVTLFILPITIGNLYLFCDVYARENHALNCEVEDIDSTQVDDEQ